MINIIKKTSLLLCITSLCFYQTIQSMQHGGAASRAAAESIASAVSDFFSRPENTPQQNDLISEINITDIMNDPEFQKSIAEDVEEITRTQSPDSDSDSHNIDTSSETGIPLSELIKKVRDSKLAQWLGFNKSEESPTEKIKAYTEGEKEQLFIALHGKLQQEQLPSLTVAKWEAITTKNPELLQNLLEGFFGKKSPEELEKNIETLKELLIKTQAAEASTTQQKQPFPHLPFKQPSQKQRNFWDSAQIVPQPPSKMALEGQLQQKPQPLPQAEPQKRIVSQAPLPPKRNTLIAKNKAMPTLSLKKPEMLKFEEETVIDKAHDGDQKLKEAIAATIEEELQQRLDFEQEAANHYEDFAKTLKTNQKKILQKKDLNEQELLQTEAIKAYNDLNKELQLNLKKIAALGQKSEKNAVAQQHERELLEKQQREKIEQDAFHKKLKAEHKARQSYLKKQALAEKQKVAQELADLQEREAIIKKQNSAQREKEIKAAEESCSNKERKALNNQIKKQKKSDKEMKRLVNKDEESKRIAIEQQIQTLYDQFAQSLEKTMQEINQRRQTESDAKNERNSLEQEEQNMQDQLRKTEQEIRNLLLAQQAEASIANSFKELSESDLNPTTTEQKNYDQAIAKTIGQKRDQINIQKSETERRSQMQQELEQLFKQAQKDLEASKQEALKKEQKRKTEEDIANSFKELSDSNLNPTATEQKSYDQAIAKTIGQKRDQINIQKNEAEQRSQMQQELEQLFKQAQKDLETSKQETIKKQQERTEKDIANTFADFPESDIITSAKFSPRSTEPKTFSPKNTQPSAKTFSQTNPPAAPASYASEPFSDDNAQAVKNMFEQYQTDIPSTNAPKSNTEPSNSPNENLNNPTKNTNDKTSTNEAENKTEPSQPIHNQNVAPKDIKKPLPQKEQSHLTNKQNKNDILIDSKKQDTQKTINTTETKPLQVVNDNFFQKEKPNTLHQKAPHKQRINNYYNMPIQNLAGQDNYKYYDDNFSYQEPILINDFPENNISQNEDLKNMSLSTNKAEQKISERSKRLDPSDFKKQPIATQKKRSPETTTLQRKQLAPDQDDASTIKDLNNKEIQPQGKAPIQTVWGEILTFFSSIFISLKEAIASFL